MVDHGHKRINQIQPDIELKKIKKLTATKAAIIRKGGDHSGYRSQAGNYKADDQTEKDNRANINKAG